MIDGKGYLHDNNRRIVTMICFSIGVIKSFHNVKVAILEEVKDD